jgi:hypothetical protein
LFLGHLVSGSAIQPDPAKILALQAMRPPTNISEHRGLMGFINFLAQYLLHFSALAKPLCRLQSTKAHFRWTEDQQQAFDLIKQLFAQGPCLAPFDRRTRTIVIGHGRVSHGTWSRVITAQPPCVVCRSIVDGR